MSVATSQQILAIFFRNTEHNQFRNFDQKRTHRIVDIFFWNSVPYFSGYKQKAPGYLSQEKQDMTILETMM